MEYLHSLLKFAVNMGASDVHIKPEHHATIRVSSDLRQRGSVFLLGSHVEQFGTLPYALVQCVQLLDHRLQSRLASSEFLGTIGILPDVRILQLPQCFLELFLLGIVVKDTPSGRWPATSCP